MYNLERSCISPSTSFSSKVSFIPRNIQRVKVCKTDIFFNRALFTLNYRSFMLLFLTNVFVIVEKCGSKYHKFEINRKPATVLTLGQQISAIGVSSPKLTGLGIYERGYLPVSILLMHLIHLAYNSW